jgi:polar amino acid transport system substrate-binding protein
MEQLTQILKSGEMRVRHLPIPTVTPGMVLVRNHYSLISAGTEGATVRTARKSFIGKAKERPQQVKQVLDVLKKQGPVQTYRAVMKKLDAYSPLGYSAAGEIIAIGEGVTGFSLGDLVACAGAGYANHAEIINVPTNLCVKLSPGADLKQASYNTLGAIALQGIRQADLRLGESCAVIGLGLIGQLTCLMLRASGVRTIGVDIDPGAVQIAAKNCVDLALVRSAPGIAGSIQEFTAGIGVDTVIITAGSSSHDPINFAGEITRKKGRVIVVGAVPTGFDRDPYYYRKELELRMSCSYGPGRYDINYEEKGIDYPAAYVRWTENRNMEAFQSLVQTGKININYLTTHEFNLIDAENAYDLIVDNTEPYLGILLKYDTIKPIERRRISVAPPKPVGKVNISFVGAGSYAQGNLLPNIPKGNPSIVCKGVMTSTGTTSLKVAERFGFEFCTSEEKDIFDNEETNTVFIATRHDSHADYVLKSLRAKKNVFVEKPLCLTTEELAEICCVYQSLVASHTSPPSIMVGFNRRFSPLGTKLKKNMGEGPMSMLYRINSGSIPADNWIQDMELGGGRIIGEACHFVDFLTYMCGSLPTRVYASAMADPQHLNDVVNINLEFENGSVGTISYFSNGSKSLDKEYIEVCRGGSTGILRDFKVLEIHGVGKPFCKKLLTQDKGQKLMVETFIQAVLNGEAAPIPFMELKAITRATLGAVDSIRSRQAIDIYEAV